MSSGKLITLIILIHFCLVESHPPGPKCPHFERFVKCAQETQATCKNLKSSGNFVCGGHCICETSWYVRDDEGYCIPMWDCPKLCPKNSEMSSKPPEVGCSCIKNHCWLPNFTECVPKETCEDYLQHNFLRIG